jgi:PD-(D/E)XK nuclease superfamily
MIIHFGLDFDSNVFRGDFSENEPFFGQKTLIRWFETQFGLGSRPENTDYLRIELFRQSLQQVGTEQKNVFFSTSFEADRFATAQHLLEWRDELLLAGWNFEADFSGNSDLERLEIFAEIERIFSQKINDPQLNPQAFGWADRQNAVLQTIDNQLIKLEKVILHDAFELLPIGWKRLFLKLKSVGVSMEKAEIFPKKNINPTLDFLQKKVQNPTENHGEISPNSPKNEGIFILKIARESDAATFFAQFLVKNPTIQPVFLLPELSRSLDDAMISEGLPSMGILSASLARPSLQILKLAPAFLRDPVDIAKLMEFVTLPIKPIDDGLALLVARLLAEKPGLFNDKWVAATSNFFEPDVPKDASEAEKTANLALIETRKPLKKQFDFWFNRRRFKISDDVPKRDVIAIYNYLTNWASTVYEESVTKNSSLLTLADQARRIKELLDALPDQRLNFLEIERIVRTIYQPAPMAFSTAAEGHFPFVHQAGGLAGATDDLVWWNFSHTEPPRFQPRWTVSEHAFFDQKNIHLDISDRQNRLNRWRQIQPILRTNRRLFFICPEKILGEDTQPNLLMGDLEAIFDKNTLENSTFNLEKETERTRFSEIFELPNRFFLEKNRQNRPPAFVEIDRPEAIKISEYETPTSLEQLFYFPHQWFLRGKTRLRAASILSISGETTLLGNLAHRFFELLLREKLADFDQKSVESWINQAAPRLFEREGATMLLYGREPERAAFLAKVRRAAWSLISLIQENHWQVEATEMDLRGTFCGYEIRGKADLILRRGEERAVVDLKWSGAKYRLEKIKNGEDLQLVLYAKMVEPAEIWAHSAYFMLEDAKIIARNNHAFTRAMTASDTENHAEKAAEIFEKMEKTFVWRMAQIERGQLEIRNKQNISALEDAYAGELFDLLEMRQEGPKWDDFTVLIK